MSSAGGQFLENRVESTRLFLERLFPPPRDFDIRLWDGTAIEGDSQPRFTVRLNSPGALRQMFRPPLELSLAEAFIRGEFDVEGDLIAVFPFFSSLASALAADTWTLFRLWQSLPKSQPLDTASGRQLAHLSGSRHSRERDRAAVQFHYDVGNAFYALWLDRRMVYSCAYFPRSTEDLDTAQEQKLELICQKLQLKPGERVLDIGCGWGGLLVYAAQKYGVQVLGVTLSKQQHMFANQRIAVAGLEGCAVKMVDYRDVIGGQFDKIVSVDMFEHVGRAHLPEYFAHAYLLLKPGGLFLNHGISIPPSSKPGSIWRRLLDRYFLGGGSFFQRHIFPDGELTPLSEVNLLAENTGFEVSHVENWRQHYPITLRYWLARLDEHRLDAIRLTSETVYRTWKLYLSAAAYGFESGRLNVNQTLLYKPLNDPQKVSLPDSHR